MSFLRRFLGMEKRSAPAESVRASDPYLAEYFRMRGARSSFGGPDAAVSSLAVASRCVSLIAEGLAALPLPIYRKLDGDGGRVEDAGHPLHRILNDAANDDMSSFEFRVLMMGDLAQQGNAFARIERDGRGAVSALYYMPHRSVGVERLASGRLRYRYTDPTRGTLVFLREEVLHLRYRSRDGILGVSPLLWAQDAVGLAMSQAELAESQARKGFVPDIAFSTDVTFEGELADHAFRRLKDQLAVATRRQANTGDPLLLEAGLKPHALATNGREAQFHEARILGLEDVARIYGVPLSVVGLGKNASYGSLAEESRALVQNCFTPWAAYGERQLALALLSTDGRRRYEIEHDLSGLQRGDMLARLQAYEIGTRAGIWSTNECRVWEGQNKIPGGDVYLRQMNMAPTGAE